VDINEQLHARHLNQVRYIESWVSPIKPILEASVEVISGLLQINTTQSICGKSQPMTTNAIEHELQNMLRECQAYLRNAEHLTSRLTSISQLVSDGLALKNQHTAQEQNGHLTKLAETSHQQNKLVCRMTEATMRDSATIRAITVATLIFLPTTFVSVSASMLKLACTNHDE
jgi:hypothetical protein